MTRGLTLRTHLTVFVTVVFAIAATVLALVAVDRIERTLVADTRSSAEAVLGQYLESINGGVATVGVVGEEVGAQFFYRDGEGRALSEIEYFRLIASAVDAEFTRLLGDRPLVSVAEPLPGLDGPVSLGESVPVGSIVLDGPPIVDPESGQLFDAAGSAITFVMGPAPLGSPEPGDLGPVRHDLVRVDVEQGVDRLDLGELGVVGVELKKDVVVEDLVERCDVVAYAVVPESALHAEFERRRDLFVVEEEVVDGIEDGLRVQGSTDRRQDRYVRVGAAFAVRIVHREVGGRVVVHEVAELDAPRDVVEEADELGDDRVRPANMSVVWIMRVK